MPSRNYRDLIVWQKAMDLVENVYRASRAFPKDELYGLTSQIRRAAVSVPSNIAEGQGRGGDPEMVRFLRIAHGSLREVETQILIAQRLGYLDPEKTQKLIAIRGGRTHLEWSDPLQSRTPRLVLPSAYCLPPTS